MVPFDEYVRGRGGELLKLARALTGAENTARDLVFLALADARHGWSRLADEDPHTYLRQGIVRGYLSFWRRSGPARADDPLARLPRRQRAVVVLQGLAGLSYLDIAEHLGGSPTAAAKLHERARLVMSEQEIVAALDSYDSSSPGSPVLLQGATVAARRRSRRRITVAASVIALVVLVSALISGRPEPEPKPSPSASGPSPVRLIPAIFQIPAFPYRPAYLPPGAGPPEVHQEGGMVSIHYANMSLYVTATQPDPGLKAPVELIWEREGRWLRLVSDQISFGEANQVVSGLEPGEITMTLPPFTITLMPAGYVLRQANPRSICLAARRDQPSAGLCVTVLPDVLGQASWPVQPVTVPIQGRPGQLIYPPGKWAELWIYHEEDRVVRVGLEQETMPEMLSSKDLVTFAEGIIIRS